MRLRIRSRAALMAASVTVTTAIAPIVGGPDPCARDPTHSASSGLPVHTLSEVSAIAQTSPSRLSPRPLARGDDGDETVCDGPVLTLGTSLGLSPVPTPPKQRSGHRKPAAPRPARSDSPGLASPSDAKTGLSHDSPALPCTSGAPPPATGAGTPQRPERRRGHRKPRGGR